MSTRSEIVFYKGKKQLTKLYHHCDGYLEGVGLDLYLLAFKDLYEDKNKTMDIDWFINILQHQINDDGYETTIYNHTDIEYQYNIQVDKYYRLSSISVVHGYNIYGEKDIYRDRREIVDVYDFEAFITYLDRYIQSKERLKSKTLEELRKELFEK